MGQSSKVNIHGAYKTVTSTRGHQYKLYKSHCSHSTHSRFFAERVINVWNCLPPSVDYSTLATFRRSIDGIEMWIVPEMWHWLMLSDIIGQLCVLLFLSVIFFSLVHSDIIIAVFSRPSFRAIVSALWCLSVPFHSYSYLCLYSIM